MMSHLAVNDERFNLLSISILKASAIPTVAVISATDDDNRTYVAYELAKALWLRGREVSIIEVIKDGTSGITLRTHRISAAHQCVRVPDRLALPGRQFRDTVRQLSQNAEATVLVAGSGIACSANVELMSLASQAIVPIRMGRRANTNDRRLRDFLTLIDVPVLGVIPTGAERAELPLSALPPRHEVSRLKHDDVSILKHDSENGFLKSETDPALL